MISGNCTHLCSMISRHQRILIWLILTVSGAFIPHLLAFSGPLMLEFYAAIDPTNKK